MKISTVILTKNSEKTLEQCIKSVQWSNELILVDDYSTDSTISLAKKYGAKLYEHALDNDFSAQRTFGLEKATGELVFFVDSDEVVPQALQEEITVLAMNEYTPIDGYFVRRIDTIWGKQLLYGETGNIWLLRLAKKSAGKWEGNVHEVWKVKGKTRKLQNSLEHYPHPTISEFLSNINYYSTLRAEALDKNHVIVSFIDIILYPKTKFFVNFLFKQGFRDGIPGFLVAVCMSFHSFLVRGKLWQLQNSHT